jgi:hypothetical protein
VNLHICWDVDTWFHNFSAGRSITLPKGYMNRHVNPQLSSEEQRLVAQNSWPGIELRNDNMGGCGVFTTQSFPCRHAICHYGGVFINHKAFLEDTTSGNDKFMLELKLRDQKWYFNHYETTSFSFGKMLNHSATCANVDKKVFQDDLGQPVVLMRTKRSLEAGEELVHDYDKYYGDLPLCTVNCKRESCPLREKLKRSN